MSEDAKWTKYNIEPKLLEILAGADSDRASAHPFGRPFVTAYQLAYLFNREHPEVVRELGLKVGGEGTGEYVSLASYLANQLQRRITSDNPPPIEGRFLWRKYQVAIEFGNPSAPIRSSMMNTNDLSMFRLVE